VPASETDFQQHEQAMENTHPRKPLFPDPDRILFKIPLFRHAMLVAAAPYYPRSAAGTEWRGTRQRSRTLSKASQNPR
jgi:hypothetical protein